MSNVDFSDLGRIEAIKLLFEGTAYQPFGEPLFFEAKAGEAVTNAQKLFLEGVDFDLMYFPLKHLGYKCIIAATGELYAVMSHPKTLSVTLGISSKLNFDHIKELWGGMLSAAREHGYNSVSLDLQPSKNGLSICVNASGAATKLTCARRPKANSKDLICVSGSLGAAYLGMQVLEREKQNFEKGGARQEELEKYKMLVGSYLKPEISAGILTVMEKEEIYPSYGYLLGRGLADGIMRLSRDSGLGAKIYADKIPFEGNSFQLGREINIDPVSAAMNGGDDYRLLFVIPILEMERFRKNFQTFDIIGHLALPEAGRVLVTPEGVEIPLNAQGWADL